MRSPTLHINWDNNCVVNQHNKLCLQRVKNLNFTHAAAQVDVIDNEQTRNIDLSSPVGVYHDHDVVPDNHYAYRVVVESNGMRSPSVPTNHIYVPDIVTDLGYPDGDPDHVMTHNISIAPRLHLDSSRVFGVSDKKNDVLRDLRSLVRHNTLDQFHSIKVQGDPVFDSRTVDGQTRYICARTDIPYNQSRSTQQMNNTTIHPVLTDDVVFNNGATLFMVIYTEYNTDTPVTIKTSGQHSVTYSNNKITLSTPHGMVTHKRSSVTPWVVFMLKHESDNVTLWENGMRVCSVKHKLTRDNRFKWSARSKNDLLGSSKRNGGFSELLLFDQLGDFELINTVSHYLFKKYGSIDSYIDMKEF